MKLTSCEVKEGLKMAKETYMKRQGYKYYVYLGPGRIEYFFELTPAQEYAEKNGVEVQEVDI